MPKRLDQIVDDMLNGIYDDDEFDHPYLHEFEDVEPDGIQAIIDAENADKLIAEKFSMLGYK